jgi:archaellum biogenesis ATPase FlaH
MSIEKTKTNLQELIADDTNRVIALSGKWGTGKSYLWDSIKASNADETVQEALYVSLFGIKDISQLKIKLVQSAMAYSDGKAKIKKRVLGAWKFAEKGLKFINLKNSPSLDELALMAVPKMLNETFIVIDDIERKHRDLDVRQIMGFIDEYTKIHKARFLLILNSDELEDKEAWETLREKSIDHELALEADRESYHKL